MRSEQLEYLIEIANSQSITKASKTLTITPQALSLAIKNLEQELGFAVLERTNKGITVTDGGKSLIRSAKRFLADVSLLQKKLSSSPTSVINCSILATLGGLSTFFPEFLCHLYQKYPHSQITINYQPYQTVIEQIENDDCEFAFYDNVLIAEKPREMLSETLHFTAIFSYKLFCIVPQKLPIARQSSLSIKTLLKYPFILLTHQHNLNLSPYALFSYFDQKPAEIIHASDPIMFNEMVSSGLGVALKLIPPNIPVEKYTLPDAKLIPLNYKDFAVIFGYLTKKTVDELSADAKKLLSELKKYATF